MNNDLWCEKYRPKCMDDIVISDRKKQTIEKWFNSFQDGTNPQCAMLFTGPPGLGKTSLAHVILDQFGYDVTEFNASDIRSKSLITKNLHELINFNNVQKYLGTGNTRPTAIIMDEVDGMFKGDRGGVDALLSFISVPSKRKKKSTSNFNTKVPIICICNIGNVKRETINNLKKECCTIEFTLPSDSEVYLVLERITNDQKMQIVEDAKNKIVEYSQGDFRRLVCLLEFIYNFHRTELIDLEMLDHCLSIICQKEQDLYVTDAVRKMINEPLNPYQIQSIYNSDKSKTPMVIHQNYVRAVSAQKTTIKTKVSLCLSIINSLILSDEIEKIMYNTQNWGLQPIQSLTCAHIPSYYINKYPKVYPIDAKWAGILSINSQAQNLLKNVHIELSNMCINKTYDVRDLQRLVEVIFIKFINDNTEEAILYILKYKLCLELQNPGRKKALSIIDKMAKYIKLSPYYQQWSNFISKNKNNRELDDKIYKYYNTGTKSILKLNVDPLKIHVKVTVNEQTETKKKPIININIKKPSIKTNINNETTKALSPEQQQELRSKRKVKIVLKKMSI